MAKTNMIKTPNVDTDTWVNDVYCPKDLIEWVNSDPDIESFLYDANLLPGQINTMNQIYALRGF